MNPRSLPLSTLSLLAVCLVLGWIAYTQHGSITRSRVANHPATPPPTSVAITAPKPARSLKSPARSYNVSYPGGAAVSAARSHLATSPSLREILRDHPEYAGVMRRRFEREMMSIYGPAIDALNLPPETAARLRELLVERQLSANDAANITEADGIQPGSPLFGKAVTKTEQEVDAEITALIGPDGQRTLRAAQSLDFYQHVAASLSPAFLTAGEHLSARQSAALAQAWYATNAVTANPEATQPGFRTPDPSTDLTPGDELLLNQASHILSPGELPILQRYLKDQNIEKRVMASYRHG